VALSRHVQYLVIKERKVVIAGELNGVELNGTFGSFVALKESMWFQSALER